MRSAGLIATTTAILFVGTALAGAVEIPPRKTGLWDIKIKLTGGAMPISKMQHCTDVGMDWRMSTLFNPMAPNLCSQADIKQVGDHYTVDSVCRSGEKTVTQHSEVSGDFQTNYTVIRQRTTKETDASEPVVSNLTLEGRYVGNCKPDQKPGDVVMAGGMKVNVRDVESFLKSKK